MEKEQVDEEEDHGQRPECHQRRGDPRQKFSKKKRNICGKHDIQKQT